MQGERGLELVERHLLVERMLAQGRAPGPVGERATDLATDPDRDRDRVLHRPQDRALHRPQDRAMVRQQDPDLEPDMEPEPRALPGMASPSGTGRGGMKVDRDEGRSVSGSGAG